MATIQQSPIVNLLLRRLSTDELDVIYALEKAGWALGHERTGYLFYNESIDRLHDGLAEKEDVIVKANSLLAGLDLGASPDAAPVDEDSNNTPAEEVSDSGPVPATDESTDCGAHEANLKSAVVEHISDLGLSGGGIADFEVADTTIPVLFVDEAHFAFKCGLSLENLSAYLLVASQLYTKEPTALFTLICCCPLELEQVKAAADLADVQVFTLDEYVALDSRPVRLDPVQPVASEANPAMDQSAEEPGEDAAGARVTALIDSMAIDELEPLHELESAGWILGYEPDAFILTHAKSNTRHAGLKDRLDVMLQVGEILERLEAGIEPANAIDDPDQAEESTQDGNTFAQRLALDIIRTDGGTQPRASLDQYGVENYCEFYTNGAKLPPLDVFYDGTNYWLADGFHRLAAAKRANLDLGGEFNTIAVNVHQGTRRDAVLFSVGANATHGLPRTNADKRRAVMVLLNDPDWSTFSDGWIANTARVSQTMVSNLRRELSTQNGAESSPKVRRGADGREINTEKIGSKPKSVPSTSAAEPEDQRVGLEKRFDVIEPNSIPEQPSTPEETEAEPSPQREDVGQEDSDPLEVAFIGNQPTADVETNQADAPAAIDTPETPTRTEEFELTNTFPEREVPTQEHSDAWNNATITLTIQLMPTAHKEANRPVLVGVRNDDDSPFINMTNGAALSPLPQCVIDLFRKLAADLPRRAEAKAATKAAANKPAAKTPATAAKPAKKASPKKAVAKKSATKKTAAKKASDKKQPQASA